MAWQPGPLPPDTWQWGGIVTADINGTGFFFADFRGDHAIICDRWRTGEVKVLANEILWWDNSLTLPPDQKQQEPPA